MLRTVPIRHLLSTDWPIIDLLGHYWSANWAQHQTAMTSDCDGLGHASVDWKAFRNLVVDAMDSGDRLKLNQMLEASDGVSWKAASTAVTPSGVRMSVMTSQCIHGVSIAAILRLWGILLNPEGDIQRIAEMLMSYAQVWIDNIDLALSTQWPILPALRLLQGIRYFSVDHSVRLEKIRATRGKVVIVLLTSTSAELLMRLVRRYQAIQVWDYVMFSPLDGESRLLCTQAASEEKCLPVINPNQLVTKYTILHSFLLGRNPVEEVIVVTDTMLLLGDPFATSTPNARDLAVGEELFSKFLSFNYMHFFNTVNSRKIVSIMYEWICEYPFAVERGGLTYLLQRRDTFVNVPTCSYLPPIEQVPELTISVLTGVASSAGWFGNPDTLIAFDCQSSTVCLNVLHEDGTVDMAAVDSFKLRLNPKAGRQFEYELDPSVDSILDPTRGVHASSKCIDSMYTNNLPRDVPDMLDAVSSDFTFDTFITHISYASGCCEKDQKICRQSGVQPGGANVSIALNGSFLDETFVNRNARILNYDRRSTMNWKTPSTQVGYYVWKPYVILKSLPSLPWNGILVYTDAGMVFTASMRPILLKYLAVSDVVAANTVMTEGHVTKRDVFVALQADDPSVVWTDQLASCFIAVRRTPRTIQLLRWWLAASGCPDIIGEEDNVHGLPNYEGFRFNNDDQSPFSVLSKRFGYTSMSHAEMTSFLEARRNIAKFQSASDTFALTNTVATREQYLHAADHSVPPFT